MTAERRLKMETGVREDDVRDDAPKGGLLHRTPRQFRVHPTHPVDHICTYPGDSCHATVARNERDGHRSWHKKHAAWDEAWQEKVEWMESFIQDQETRIAAPGHARTSPR